SFFHHSPTTPVYTLSLHDALPISTILWTDLTNHYVWMVLTITVSYGIVGFIDDYRKVREKGSKGLFGRWKLIWQFAVGAVVVTVDRKSTRLNSSHVKISYAVFCLK